MYPWYVKLCANLFTGDLTEFILLKSRRIYTGKIVFPPLTSGGNPALQQRKPDQTRHPSETSPHFLSNDHCEEGHLKALQAFRPPLMKPFIRILLYNSHKTVVLSKYVATCLSNICFFIPAEEEQTALNNMVLSSRHIFQAAFSRSPEQLRGNLRVRGDQSTALVSTEWLSVMSIILPLAHLKPKHGRILNVAGTWSLSSPYLTLDYLFTVDNEKSL